MTMARLTTLALASLLVLNSTFAAEAAGEKDALTELAKQEQNPLARIIRLQLEDNAQFGFGPDNQVLNFLRIQPIIPFDLSEDWSLIIRPVIPIVHQPWPESADGLSDIALQLLLSPEKSGKFIWGAGPAFLFPTATGKIKFISTEKWSAGPAVVGVYTSGPWVVGALVNQLWSFAGNDSRPDVSAMTLRPIINYNLPHGWSLVSAPSIGANWEANSDNRWLVPLGGGVAKLFPIGSKWMSISLEGYYHVESPEIGPDWQLRLQLTFLLPK
ncbi:MAG: neuromedin U [Candidatus Methylomirabilales bacterium]